MSRAEAQRVIMDSRFFDDPDNRPDAYFTAESFRDMSGDDDETWSPEDWIDIRREAINMAETHQILLESGLTLTQIQAMKAWWTV